MLSYLKQLAFIVIAAIVVATIIIVAQESLNKSQRKSTVTTPNEATDSSHTTMNTTTTPTSKQYNSPPKMTIDPAKSYSATLATSKGTMTVELFANDAPKTVNNFVFLAREQFYDGTRFHRIIKDFMIQGGDPLGNGTGGPGYTFDDEPITRDYTRGIVAMANSGPNTNGSQFFIMHADYPLPKNYVIFGEVTGGLDVLDAIATTPAAMGPGGEQSSPTETITLQTVTIEEK